MRLSEYAKQMGVHWRTANRWYHNGQIEGAYQLPTGTIIVPDPPQENQEKGKNIIYARVSNSSRKNTDLEYQAERLKQFTIANGWEIDQIIKEVGSGLNDQRTQLTKILESNEKIDRLIVEHKDRLTRFGYHYIEIIAKTKGIEIIIVNKAESDKEDLLEDLTNIITSFCARIYGQRRGKRKTETITEELNNA